jgi:transposase
MKKISKEKKNNIVHLLEKGIPARQIARQLQVDEKTVRKIQNEVCPAVKKFKGGCPAKISKATTRCTQRAVTSGKANTATKVARQPRDDAIANVHPITVRRALRRVSLVARRKINKPRLQDRHKKLRLEFAKKHASWTVEDWSRVIWSDKTKINRLGSDGRKWVWK